MKECIAMLLAGGQGSRLYALTQETAKPAVYFGGKYRIIDFPLSNCVNSGIDTVGVLTQYQPLELNEYLGNGQPWDLDRNYGGVHVLPPYQKATGSDWYKGTANAIYQNINFIERYEPEYVLILSGDHIYKMNYELMLDQHKKTGADCTIAVLDVPKEEASRFGIMTCNEEGRIIKFTEKPKHPDSTLASMGIYIFSWDVLKQYLIDDERNPESENDFGKNIIPRMLKDSKKLYAYNFVGYWKDVGTIDSLWDANMDLIAPTVPFDVWDNSWKIYSRSHNVPPQYVGKDAVIEDSMVSEGCVVEGNVNFSLLFQSVTVEEGAKVRGSIIMPNSVIKKGATVQYAIVGENCVIEEGAYVGEIPEKMDDLEKWGVTVLGNGVHIAKDEKVEVKAMVYGEKKES
ncbi:MAG: glucose-1-phosphate adenylyltransferase [Oscillospiraceae bacterium]|nr:glucose-1-phosphate adenylyltransferase [Oscillospiraceae bacterium]